MDLQVILILCFIDNSINILFIFQLLLADIIQTSTTQLCQWLPALHSETSLDSVIYLMILCTLHN